MPLFIRQRLSHGLLMSTILYGLEVVSGTSGVQLVRLRKIVNSVVRFIYNVRRRDHISRYVKRFIGCSFNEFISYRNLICFYNIIKSGKPEALRRCFRFSHSTRNPQIVIPRIYKSCYARSFLVRVARCWNVLHYDLRIFSHTNNVFRLKLMRHFALL